MKYELVKEDSITDFTGRRLFRIRALIAITAIGVSIGDLGGYIEKEANLSQVSGDAWVFGNARISGDARISQPMIAATRTDGYLFIVTATLEGPRIMAGCRYFTFSQAESHWKKHAGEHHSAQKA